MTIFDMKSSQHLFFFPIKWVFPYRYVFPRTFDLFIFLFFFFVFLRYCGNESVGFLVSSTTMELDGEVHVKTLIVKRGDRDRNGL